MHRAFGTGVGSLLLAAVLTLLLLPDEARSQDQVAPTIRPTVGSTVRLWAPTVADGRIEGKVVRADERSLWVGGGGEPLSVPRHAITRFEISTGRHSHVWTGLGIGAAAGGLLGGASGCFPMVGCGGDAGQHLGAAAVGAVAGAGWGALIGACVHGERWRTVPLEQVHLALAPARGGGLGLTVAYSF